MRARIASNRGVGWRLAEYVLLFAGLVLLDAFIWVKASAIVYQSWENWSFDQQVKGEPVSVCGFLRDELRFGPGTLPPVNRPLAGRPLERRPAAIPRDEVVGRLEIARLGLRAIVREGSDEDTLRRAVGHLPSSPVPGEPGNVAIAGHRDTFFRPLQGIRVNDRITFETLHGRYEYAVDSVKVVRPDDVSVLRASSQPELTMITCYPFHYIGSAPKRFIVEARQIGAAPEMEQASVTSDASRSVRTLPGL